MRSVLRNCLSCGHVLQGRVDKKFCDDGCRNNFNNEVNAIQNKQLRNINSILKRNRAILFQILPVKKKQVKVAKEQLIGLGFNFKYMTHQHAKLGGLPAYFCYELGWMSLDEDILLIVRQA